MNPDNTRRNDGEVFRVGDPADRSADARRLARERLRHIRGAIDGLLADLDSDTIDPEV